VFHLKPPRLNGRKQESIFDNTDTKCVDWQDLFDFRLPAAMLKSAVLWGVTRRRVAIVYRRCGTTYWSHPHGSRVRVGKKASQPIRYPETSVNNYYMTPRNTPEDRSFHKHLISNMLCKGVHLVYQKIKRNKFLSWFRRSNGPVLCGTFCIICLSVVAIKRRLGKKN
jgi:hypothetical protein